MRGTNWDIAATDGKKIAKRAREEKIDLAVLGPETAIAAGVGDQLREACIATFGPDRAPGRLESSKIFSKRFMERHGVPTARAVVVHSLDGALKALDEWKHSGCVLKADGLAAGKGVVVASEVQTARAVVSDWYKHNRVPGGGSDLLLEERLTGREVSVFAISDGRAMLPIAAACDYKRAGDGDTGPNTGGMGAYSPPSGFSEDMFDQVRARILAPVLRGLLAEGLLYVGVLYCGLMWTEAGPSVIEFNARFGDPETQVLMPRVRGDFAALLKSAADGALDTTAASFSEEACVGVVLVTPDYPKSSAPMRGLNVDVSLAGGQQVFWGASTRKGSGVDSAGGRVMTVTATGASVEEARVLAYDGVREVTARFEAQAHLSCRSDIAADIEERNQRASPAI